MKNSFVLYTEDIDNLIEDLDEFQIGKLIIAINKYVKTKQMPDFKFEPVLSMAFKFIKNKLDRDIDKWEKTKQARSDAGKKGGAKKGNQNARKEKSIDNYKEKQAKQAKQPVNDYVNVNVNVNDNVNDNNTEQPKQQVAVMPTVVPKKSPQQRIFDYFANEYKALTGFKYKSQSSDFINLAKLIKDYKEEDIIQKIEWLKAGCVNRVFWFAKTSGINSFTVGKLYSQWNEILPQYTAEQLKEQAEKKKEEERMKRVLAEAQRLREERR